MRFLTARMITFLYYELVIKLFQFAVYELKVNYTLRGFTASDELVIGFARTFGIEEHDRLYSQMFSFYIITFDDDLLCTCFEKSL